MEAVEERTRIEANRVGLAAGRQRFREPGYIGGDHGSVEAENPADGWHGVRAEKATDGVESIPQTLPSARFVAFGPEKGK
jgi:hypothetical protein